MVTDGRGAAGGHNWKVRDAELAFAFGFDELVVIVCKKEYECDVK